MFIKGNSRLVVDRLFFMADEEPFGRSLFDVFRLLINFGLKFHRLLSLPANQGTAVNFENIFVYTTLPHALLTFSFASGDPVLNEKPKFSKNVAGI